MLGIVSVGDPSAKCSDGQNLFFHLSSHFILHISFSYPAELCPGAVPAPSLLCGPVEEEEVRQGRRIFGDTVHTQFWDPLLGHRRGSKC